jgi:hypothetical protein
VVPLALLLLTTLCPAHAYDLADLPKPEVGFGFYYSPGRCAYGLERAYFEDMAAHGCNTLTVQANGVTGQVEEATAAERIARQVNLAAEVGIADPRFPILCYSVGPQDVVDARRYKRPELAWPELVVQTIDEPNHGQEAILRRYRDEAHAAGLRIGTAVAGYVCTGYHQTLPYCAPEDEGKWAPGMGEYIDLWVILVGTLTPRVRLAARHQGAEVGAYYPYPASPIMDRWTFGLWAWKARTRINLLWAYIDKQESWDFSRVTETPEGPVQRSDPPGYAEGITDYRVLQAVRDLRTPEALAWLKGVERETTLGWWPRGYVRPPEEQAAQVPTMDLDRVRREGMALLDRAQKGGG